MEILNRGKVATQSQSKFDCLVEKEENEQTVNIKHCKMNSILNLEEKFSGYLK